MNNIEKQEQIGTFIYTSLQTRNEKKLETSYRGILRMIIFRKGTASL